MKKTVFLVIVSVGMAVATAALSFSRGFSKGRADVQDARERGFAAGAEKAKEDLRFLTFDERSRKLLRFYEIQQTLNQGGTVETNRFPLASDFHNWFFLHKRIYGKYKEELLKKQRDPQFLKQLMSEVDLILEYLFWGDDPNDAEKTTPFRPEEDPRELRSAP